jgi:hypothetical protein
MYFVATRRRAEQVLPLDLSVSHHKPAAAIGGESGGGGRPGWGTTRRRACRSCSNPRRPYALAGSHATLEDAGDCEGCGMLSGRISSVRSIR